MKKGIITPQHSNPAVVRSHGGKPGPMMDKHLLLILRIMQKRTCCHSSSGASVHLAQTQKTGIINTSRVGRITHWQGLPSPRVSARFCGQPCPKEAYRVYTPCCPGLSIPLSSPGRCKPHRKTVPASPLLPHDPEQQPFCAVSWQKDYSIGAFCLSTPGKVGVFPYLCCMVPYRFMLCCRLSSCFRIFFVKIQQDGKSRPAAFSGYQSAR